MGSSVDNLGRHIFPFPEEDLYLDLLFFWIVRLFGYPPIDYVT